MNRSFLNWLITELKVSKINGLENNDLIRILRVLEEALTEQTNEDDTAASLIATSIGRNNLEIILKTLSDRKIPNSYQRKLEKLSAKALGQVFISYARADETYAIELEAFLNNKNISTWRDKRDLDKGQDFSGEIELAIRRSTHVIVCLTPDVKRPDSFVRREIAYALGRRKPIVPLLYPDGEPPLQISTWTHIDMSQSDAYSDLIGRLYGSTSFPLAYHSKQNSPELVAYLDALHDWASKRLDEGVHSLITLAAASVPQAVRQPSNETSPTLGFNFVVSPVTLGKRKLVKSRSDTKEASFTSFPDAFNHFGGRLLLLGDPGAGKKTTLLAFARDAAVERLNDASKPIPILASIHRWNKRQNVAEWALSEQSEVDPKVFAGQKLLYIFDGLDELGGVRLTKPNEASKQVDPRLQFIKNLQRQIHGQVVVSSRVKDYADIGQKIELPGAVTLQPLTDIQIQNYLEVRKQSLLWDGLRTDTTLLEMARTPLLLALLVIAYGGPTRRRLTISLVTESSIFDRFIHRRFVHERARLPSGSRLPFSEIRTRRVLSELAANMWSEFDGYTEFDLYDVELVLSDDAENFIDFAHRMHFLQSFPDGNIQFIHLKLRDFCAIPILLERLESDEIGDSIIWAIGQIGEASTLPSLTKVLLDTDSDKRYAAIIAIGEIETSVKVTKLDNKATVAALVNCLDDKDEDVRRAAVDTLSLIGDPIIIPRLIALLDDPSIEVQQYAIETLAYFDDPEVAKVFVKRLLNPDTRDEASHYILRMG